MMNDLFYISAFMLFILGLFLCGWALMTAFVAIKAVFDGQCWRTAIKPYLEEL
jgi:hypothetical protein